MIIDLRTEAEISRKPKASDIVIPTPLPPLGPQAVCQLAETLHEVGSKFGNGRRLEVFCAKGNRSRLAFAMLKSMGFQVVDRGGVG
jgi:rhodanese-related sulfurtransferase